MAVTGYFDAVQKIYIAFYQRPADPAGLRYWAERLEGADGNGAAIINAFANSAEASALYGSIDEETIADTIAGIYQALFARSVEPEGLAFYTSAFMNGTLTAGNIALAILNAAREQDQTAIENKLKAANEFTQQVDGRDLADATFGSGDDFAFDYAGEAIILAARAALAGVTRDPATVLDPADVKDILQGSPTGGVEPAPSGRTFTLIEASELVKGTSFNDRINGTEKTLPGDTIEGGGGKDTLKLVISEAGISGVSDAAVSGVESVVIESKGNVGIIDISEGPFESAFDISNWSGVHDVKVTTEGQASVSIVSEASSSVVVETSGGFAFVQDATAKSIQVEAGGYAGVMAGNDVVVHLEVTEQLFSEPSNGAVFLPEQGGYGVVQAGNNADITIAANEDNESSLLLAIVQAEDEADINVSGFYAAIVRAGDKADVSVTAGGYASIYVGEESNIDLDFTDVTLPDGLESELEQDFGGYAEIDGGSIGELNISNAGLRGDLALETDNEAGAARISAEKIDVISLTNVFNERAAFDVGLQTAVDDGHTYAAYVEINTGEDENLDLVLENSKIMLWLGGSQEATAKTLNLEIVSDSTLEISSQDLTALNIKGTGDLDLSLFEYVAVKTVDASDFNGSLVLDLSGNAVAVEVQAGGGTNEIHATSLDDVITVGSGINFIHAGYGADTVNLEEGEGTDALVFSTIWDSTKERMDIVEGFQASLTGANDILDFGGMFGNVSYVGLLDSALAVADMFEEYVSNAVFDSTSQILYIDTDASGTLDDTDFAIHLVGVTELSMDNFHFDSQQG